MARVHPQESTSSSSSCNCSQKETYTLWMKSLVLHSNGCTVYDSNGDIVYRVDNYDRKGRRKVNLMDLQGGVLYTIHKKFLGFGRWDGYRSSGSKPWFKVKRCHKIVNGKVVCEIRVGRQRYCIVRMNGKATFTIANMEGQVVAQVKQKQSSAGIVLGDDVLTLEVEEDTDHSLIMAFVTVYGLICGRM
ncbi:protein LURP-one-related 4-like [Prosopis cineraria]|uniref:protein LURP-one-related 4-like n=1 Tax=Prosopis cineraria TaxID=364024 RepID=UPI00240EB9E6|nr:protein LURP-one-related 4-like [Prosopis cineraria]